jgi:hypothetical protein
VSPKAVHVIVFTQQTEQDEESKSFSANNKKSFLGSVFVSGKEMRQNPMQNISESFPLIISYGYILQNEMGWAVICRKFESNSVYCVAMHSVAVTVWRCTV